MKTQRRTMTALTPTVLGFAFLLLSSTTPSLAQETAEELYQAGLYQEEVQGNLSQAIGLFERIVSEFPSNRAMAANALVHIGLCHEKLGSQKEREQGR